MQLNRLLLRGWLVGLLVCPCTTFAWSGIIAGPAPALVNNPTDCSAGQYAQAIDASGNLTCSGVSAFSADPTDCGDGEYATAIDASGNLTCSAAGAALNEGVYTPVVSSSNGGDTLPVYDPIDGHFLQSGSWVFVQINASGDGGDEGSGSGVLRFSLPTNCPVRSEWMSDYAIAGLLNSNGTISVIYVYLEDAATFIEINKLNFTSIFPATPGDQNSSTRQITAKFMYKTDDDVTCAGD